MKFLFLLCLYGLSFYNVFSQENPNSSAIQTSMKVKALQEKKAEYHRRTNGECDGYRVKIHFSADRSKANEMKARFSSKYNDVPTHDDYQQPNFVVNVGDVPKTASPVPVSSVNAVLKLAEVKLPNTVAFPILVICPVKLALVITDVK